MTGSISVVHALMRADLVDQYRLFVYPVFSSRGRNLMPSGLTPQGLTLTDCMSFRSGSCCRSTPNRDNHRARPEHPELGTPEWPADPVPGPS